MVREIVLDTETTGFEPEKGHRLVEIGCLELINHLPTGKTFHHYINPERDVPADAFRVHGLSTEFLSSHPVFSVIAQDFLDFIADSPLVIHNAAFDMKFLNFELKRIGFEELSYKRAIDTVLIARKKFPGSPANLDALCKRFKIDNSSRTLHGALLDSELLAEVYLELLGGRQSNLAIDLDVKKTDKKSFDPMTILAVKKERKEARLFPLSHAEEKAHLEMIEQIKNSFWVKRDII